MYAGNYVSSYLLLSLKKAQTVASTSLVFMLGYITTLSTVNSLAPGGKGSSLFSLFNILLESRS